MIVFFYLKYHILTLIEFLKKNLSKNLAFAFLPILPLTYSHKKKKKKNPCYL